MVEIKTRIFEQSLSRENRLRDIEDVSMKWVIAELIDLLITVKSVKQNISNFT